MARRCDNCKPDLCLFAGGGSGGGGGSSTLSGLTDVDISNPTNGQTLVYNATSGKWENGAGGGGMLVVTITQSDNTLMFDKTWQEIYDADAVSIVMLVDNKIKNYITCISAFSELPVGGGDTVYVVSASSNGEAIQFVTNSASGYPSFTFE